MDRDLASVLDIVRMGRLIGEFVSPASRTDLDANPQLRLAVLHALLIIGKAVKRLSLMFPRSASELAPDAVAAGAAGDLRSVKDGGVGRPAPNMSH